MSHNYWSYDKTVLYNQGVKKIQNKERQITQLWKRHTGSSPGILQRYSNIGYSGRGNSAGFENNFHVIPLLFTRLLSSLDKFLLA